MSKIKWQVCSFKRTKESEPEPGLAKLRSDFGVYDVEFIIDMDGNKIPNSEQETIWNYSLNNYPIGKCIEI